MKNRHASTGKSTTTPREPRTGSPPVVRDGAPPDHSAILALNNGAVPHVNALGADEFAWITRHAAYFRVAVDGDGIAGFVIALAPGVDYWSLNYRWFAERGGDFLYLDRIVVAERARRGGIGSALYADIAAFANGRWPCIALEVNLRPPNPGSLAFHERLGFRRVGIREEDEGAKAVVLMERTISSSASPPRTGGPS